MKKKKNKMEQPETILIAAENIAEILQMHGVDVIIIGALAMSPYNYIY